MINNCPDCGALLKIRDIKKGQCWKCNSSSILDAIEKEKIEKEKIKKKKIEKEKIEKKKIENLEKSPQKREKMMENKLSEHYSGLRTYKNVLMYIGYLVTILSSISVLYSVWIIGESIVGLLLTLIPLIISLCITWYFILNTVKIINFLFDLDKHKSDK